MWCMEVGIEVCLDLVILKLFKFRGFTRNMTRLHSPTDVYSQPCVVPHIPVNYMHEHDTQFFHATEFSGVHTVDGLASIRNQGK